jgi:hypothetical protein
VGGRGGERSALLRCPAVILRSRVTLIAAALAAVLAACGSGGDDRGPATTPTQTRPATTPAMSPKAPPAQPSARPEPREQPGSGGTSAPSGGSERRTSQQAQRDFEKYCETHPGACGD